MTSDAKQRAQEGLLEMVELALTAIRTSLEAKGKAPRGATQRSADAWRVLDAVLEREATAGAQAAAAKRLPPEAAVAELRRRLEGNGR